MNYLGGEAKRVVLCFGLINATQAGGNFVLSTVRKSQHGTEIYRTLLWFLRRCGPRDRRGWVEEDDCRNAEGSRRGFSW